MKNRLTLSLLVFTFCFAANQGFAIVGVAAPIPAQQNYAASELETNRSLDQTSLEHQLGRKLKFKEKVALKVLRKKTRRQAKASGDKAVEEVKMESFALASFICGVVGLFIFGYILGTLAIVFGGIAMSRIKKNPEFKKGKGLAITGMVLGIIGIILVSIFLAL